LSSIATLATAVGGLARSATVKGIDCTPVANLYRIENGEVIPTPVISIH